MAGPRSIGGLVWPTLRLFILTFNLCMIFNLVLFSRNDDHQQKHNGHTPRKAHTLHHNINNNQQQQHRTTSVLQDCQDHDSSFVDLRNERQRHHKSPFDDDQFCSKLPLGATPASLWLQHAEQIFAASLHPSDKDQVHAPWTRHLLNLLSPHVLDKGLRRSPSHASLQKIMKIIQTKLSHPHDKSVPPLEVAIVGGSVTEGGGCDKTPPTLNIQGEKPTLRGQVCAWPHRLQLLVDAFLGPGIVRIHNLAVGGTNSLLAIPVLDYWLFPHGSPLLERGPDVIVNAYSANDNLPPVDKRGPNSNTTGDNGFFLDTALSRASAFIRTALFSRPCREDPLVLFVDEYLGNQHDFILGELFRFEAVDAITDWYHGVGTGAISSAQVVRRWVYANTQDEVFSAHWVDRRGGRNVDVHFGMAGHELIAWTVAYSMLTMALNFCEEEISRSGDALEAFRQSTDGSNGTATMAIDQDPHTVAIKFVPTDVLQLVEHQVPPNLDVSLQVKDVASIWHSDALARNKSLAEYCGDTSSAQALPCSFAFVAAPMGTVRNAGALNGYMKQYVIQNDGWSGQSDMRNGWQNKLGYVAGKAGASVKLRIPQTPNKVKVITLHTLKSYGEKWAESTARFHLEWKHDASGKSYNTTFDILGYHNQTTSIAYPFILDLGENTAEKGSTLDLQIDLVGGTTFKINAMMLCSR